MFNRLNVKDWISVGITALLGAIATGLMSAHELSSAREEIDEAVNKRFDMMLEETNANPEEE